MRDFLQHLGFCLVKIILGLVEVVTDLLFGYTLTGGSKNERLMARDYENSAHMVKILWKSKMTIFSATKSDNFLWQHERYLHPEYILQHPNVTLMTVEKEFATFAVSDPATDIYDSKKFPFAIFSVYSEAEKLIILPIESLHKLADTLGDPSVPVCATSMTARCGSTLLVQVMNRVPGTRTLSEPLPTTMVAELRTMGQITPKESRRLLQSAVRLQLKVEPNANLERIFWKLTPSNSVMMKDLMSLFPNFKYMFNTRHPVPSARSLNYVLNYIMTGPYKNLGFFWRDMARSNFMCSFDPKYSHVLRKYNRWIQNASFEELSVMCYSNVLASYFDFKDKYQHVILYENLSKHPEQEIGKIFDVIGVDKEHVPAALEALKHDSQDGILGQQGGARKEEVSATMKMHINEYMSLLSIPDIKHDMSVEEFKAIFSN